MTAARLLLVVFSLAATTPTPVASAGSGSPDEDSCPLWIAPSYITEQAATIPKFGLFAGRNYEQNSTLPLSELAIPLVDFFEDFTRQRAYGAQVLALMENFMWTQEKIGSMWEGYFSSPAVVPGVGILANYHSTYSNADFLHASMLLRETGDEFPKAGEASPSRGAVTPYFNATLKATQSIPAGMEIFAGRSTLAAVLIVPSLRLCLQLKTIFIFLFLPVLRPLSRPCFCRLRRGLGREFHGKRIPGQDPSVRLPPRRRNGEEAGRPVRKAS